MPRFDRKHAVSAVAIAAQLLITVGCGYRSVLAVPPSRNASHGRDASVADAPVERAATRIAVLAFRNDSPEPWLDRILTDAMRREIGARGRFDFVDDPDLAEFVLRGRIRPLDVDSRSFSRFVAALEYRLTLRLDLEVVLARGDVIRLDPEMLSESDVYLASADIEVTRRNRLEVLRHLSDLLASRVADSIELIESPMADAQVKGGG